MRRSPAAALLAAFALPLTACAADDAGTGDAGDRLAVAAAFYPLAFAAEQVGGDRVAVTQVAPPGAEPHDLELTPRDLTTLADAGLVVYLSDFMPAIDDAVATTDQPTFDAAEFADLTLTYTPIEDGEAETDETGTDPHFWLDPIRMSAVAEALADRLAELDPTGAAEYRSNAAGFAGRLADLDQEWSTATATCANRTLVTSHAAFGYLADRYDFSQYGITGLTPEEEPTPQALAAAAEFIRANDVATIYFESLVSPAIAETLAAETGAATAVLDPIEGLAEESDDYFSLMADNLESVRVGQSCS